MQYDNENITKQFAGDRASLYGKITKRKLFPEEIKDFETDQERRIKNGYLTPEDWEASPAESKEDKASPTESTKEEVADKEAQRLLAIKEELKGSLPDMDVEYYVLDLQEDRPRENMA